MSDHDSLQSPTGSSGLIKGSADSYAHSRDQDAAGVIEHSGIPALTRASIVQSSSLSPLHHCCSVYSPSCRRKHDRHTTRRRCPSAAHTAGPVASSRPAADPRLRLIHLSPVLPSLSSWSPDSGFQSDLRRRGKTGRQTDGGTEEPAASSASTSSATEKRTAAARTGRKMRLQILAPLVLLLLLTGLESNVNARKYFTPLPSVSRAPDSCGDGQCLPPRIKQLLITSIDLVQTCNLRIDFLLALFLSAGAPGSLRLRRAFSYTANQTGTFRSCLPLAH